jgi:hypothetical protein
VEQEDRLTDHDQRASGWEERPDDPRPLGAAPKQPPPAFEDRVTVQPEPPGPDREHAVARPDEPMDGPEGQPDGR